MYRPSDHGAELSEEEFRLLRDLIHERLGLYFGENQRPSLRARLGGRLTSLDLRSFEDYYRYLRFGPDRAAEMLRLAGHVTNNETYFFRESPQLQVFADTLLRSLKERKAAAGDRRLRILSAGCSTGEEAHTLAMIAYDSGQFFWSWRVEVIGLDIDAGALERARRGVYFHNSFRALSPALVERHFVKEGSGHRVREPIRRLVQLRLGNILEPESYADLAPLDTIVCRNVLIYFSEESTRRAVQLFHRALAPGGYLLLGHAESLSRVTDAFTPIRFQGAMVYQKPEAAR